MSPSDRDAGGDEDRGIPVRGKVEQKDGARWLVVRGVDAELVGGGAKLRVPGLGAGRSGAGAPPIGGGWPGPLLECDGPVKWDGPVEQGTVRFRLGRRGPARRALDDLRLVPAPPARRLLLAFGCRNYDHNGLANLIDVPTTLQRVEALFCSGGEHRRRGLGYVRADLALGNSPNEAEVRAALAAWAERETPGRDDVVAVWVSCHGLVDRKLRLLMRDSGPGGGLVVRTVLDLLTGAGVQCGLLVADCCHAAAGSADASRELSKAIALALDASAPRPAASPRPDAAFVSIGAAHAHEGAAQGALVKALEHAVYERRLGGYTSAFLDPRLVVAAAQAKLDHQDAYVSGRAVIAPVLPNPHRDVPADPDEYRVHWDPRARGVEEPAVPDLPNDGEAPGDSERWLFTGRHAALERAVGWLAADGRVCAVTGDPGSGKSALLGRLVTLSNPLYRERAGRGGALEGEPDSRLPPPDGVRFAVLARQQPVEGVLLRLYAGMFGELPATGAALGEELDRGLERLAREGGAPVVALDALDEAINPSAVALELGKLVRAQRLRLLVGCRRTELPALRDHAPLVIDLDEPEYFEESDVHDYAFKALAADLLAGREPSAEGGAEPERRRQALLDLAAAIAARAGRSFFFARALAGYASSHGLAAADAADLPADVGAAVDADLAARLYPRLHPEAEPLHLLDAASRATRLGATRGVVHDLLRPLAYARGDGLPISYARGDGLPPAELWPRIGSAISGASYTAPTVEDCLDQLRPYLAETGGDGVPCYRLNHELLVDLYREPPPAYGEGEIEGRVQEVERRIFDALLALVPRTDAGRPDWLAADQTPALRYARAHLADHAAAGGRLDRLIENPAYLVAADPARLAATLRASPSQLAREFGHVYERTVHRLPRAGERIGSQAAGEIAAYLELHARQEGYGELADRLARAPLGQPWHAPLAAWPSTPHRILHGHDGWVRGVACARLAGGAPVAVTAGEDGTARVWDLEGGRQLAALEGHRGRVNGVACARLAGGGPVAVTAGRDGTARVWDLEGGRQLAALEGHRGLVTGGVNGVACARLAGGGPVAVTAGRDGTARVWDLEGGRQVAALEGHRGQVFAVACARLPGGVPVAVTAGRDGTARVWDLEGGRQVAALEGHAGPVNGVACAERPGGVPVAVTAGRDGTARVWDLEGGRQVAALEGHAGPVNGVACARLADGAPVAVTAGEDGTARVWDLAAGRHLAALEGHDGPVRGVACAERPGGAPVAVTAGEDGTARVWGLERGRQLAALEGHDGLVSGGVNGVACAELAGGASVAVTAGRDGTARVWDLEGGRRIAALEGHDGPVNGVACARLAGGTSVAVTAGDDGTARVWDLDGGRQLAALEGHDGAVRVVACARLADGTPVAVTAGATGPARVWDLDGCRQTAALKGAVRVVACARLADGTPVAVTAGETVWGYRCEDPYGPARVWDLDGGRQTAALKGGVRVVACARLADGTPVAVTAGGYGTARVWDLEGGRLVAALEGEHGWVHGVACARLADGTPVAVTVGWDVARVWDDLAYRRLLSRLWGRHRRVLLGRRHGHIALAALSDGLLLLAAAGYHADRIALWRLRRLRPTGDPTIVDLGARVGGLAFDADRRLVVATDRGVVVVELPSGG